MDQEKQTKINHLENIIDELFQELKYNQLHNLPTDKLTTAIEGHKEEIAMIKAGITEDMNDLIFDYDELRDDLKNIIDIAIKKSKITHCIKYGVGAVIFDEKFKPITIGYNHVTSGLIPCKVNSEGCYRVANYGSDSNVNRYKYNRSIHAEQDALMKLMVTRKWQPNLSILVTAHPCMHCAKLLAESGIKNVYYLTPIIKEKEAFMVFKAAEIDVIMIKNAPLSIAKNDH